MTAKNRATLIGKLHTALKKHFKPAPPSPGRPLMEHVLYASLLEDTPTDLADEGFAKCEQDFFDWNEVRVTTVTELAEVLSRLPSPTDASIRLKRNLQSMFEAFYNFDIDYLKKENLSKAVAKFEAMPGMSPFVLSYLIQHGLGGHAIPIDKSAMKLMWLAGIVSEAESASGKVPGLERTIPKNRAIEFSSLLHQAGVAFQHNPKDKAVWDVLLSVNKDAKKLYETPVAAPSAKASKKTTAKIEAPAEKTAPAKPAPASRKPAEKKQTSAPDAPPKPSDTTKIKPVTEQKKLTKPASDSRVSKSSPKEEKAKPQAIAASKPSNEKSKSTKGAPAPVPAAGKTPVSGKTPPVKPASAKTAPAKPVSKKASEEKKVDTKPAPAKPSKKAEPAKKGGSPSPAKAVSKASEKADKKPLSKKSEPAKPASGKSVAAKPLSGKIPAMPEPKKAPAPKLTPEKKGVASANKKLTKQKPR